MLVSVRVSVFALANTFEITNYFDGRIDGIKEEIFKVNLLEFQ